MRILTIHPGHNSTVALMQDGAVSSVVSQEKFDNIKNSAAFPGDAIKAVLADAGLEPKDVDRIGIAGYEVFPERCYAYLYNSNNEIKHDRKVRIAKRIESSFAGKTVPFIFSALREKRRRDLLDEGVREFSSKLDALGFADTPKKHIEHHTCHARAAYHASARSANETPALVFTLDGSGDGLCATVTRVHNATWERIAATPARASLGGIYANTTRFLGMKILEHEYKVMGLAPYCKGYHLKTYERVFDRTIGFDAQNPLVFRSSVNAMTFYDYLVEHAVGERFDNIAGAVQHLLEERVITWIRKAVEMTGIRRVFTGGGAFMNVKMNKRIQEMGEVEEAFFMPSCGDESNPIGAAYALALEAGEKLHPLEHLYLGLEYSDAELAKFIEQHSLRTKYRVTAHEDMEETIAQMIADREIVARFDGRCEWGARSLGNRAILGHPSHMDSFYTVNDLIKSRDFWMPFAPSILDTAASKYLANYDPVKVEAPFMITAYDATPLAVEHLRAAMHQGDHTLRPQVVTERANPSYYRLIKAFERRTGVGGVLNTSFNLHGYPLVGTPEQALMTFERSGLRHLTLGRFLVSKG